MIVYVAAASSERERARRALEAVKTATGLVLAHDWIEEIESRSDGSANHGIGPEESKHLAEVGVSHVLRASTLWLLVPYEPTIGLGVELGTFSLAKNLGSMAPRRIIASGGRRDVSIFMGLADHYLRSDASALKWIVAFAKSENDRITKLAPSM